MPMDAWMCADVDGVVLVGGGVVDCGCLDGWGSGSLEGVSTLVGGTLKKKTRVGLASSGCRRSGRVCRC